MFLKKGYELTTIDAVAKAMSMTKRTIYNLYPNKESLFKAAVNDLISRSRVTLEQVRALETDDLEATLTAVARMRIESFLSPAGMRLQRLINPVTYRFPELLYQTFEQNAGPTIEFLKDLLQRHAQSGAICVARPDISASIFLSIAVGIPARRALLAADQSATSELDEYIQYCVRSFLRGVEQR